MRIINPGPGELLDRWTILELKIEHARDRGMSWEHFEDELFAIKNILTAVQLKYQDAFPVWKGNLSDVNRAVWVATDQQHELFGDEAGTWVKDVKAFAECSLRAVRFNDIRGRMIHHVNEKCGEAVGQEKVNLMNPAFKR
jgi:hypothetical protein